MVWSNPGFPQGAEAQVGKYRLLRRIASGGMAEVYLATDDGKSLWAVKLMLPHLADHSEFLGLFLDEARLASQINHVNVARVRDMGMENGRLFLAMEYARGQPLSALITRLKEKNAVLSPAQAAAILAQSAAGLNAAHEAKARDGTPMELVHRDVSPQNLLLTEEGVVKVVDFGIAKARNKLVVTQVNTTRGKPWYMSPEQMRGEKLDRRADVFSLGAVLFELLLGARLFEGDVDQVMYKALNEPLPDILKLKPDVPRELAEMIKRACARRPEDRFESAWELEQELNAFAAGQGGAGDLGALIRDNFPRMPATVDEVLGNAQPPPASQSRPAMRSGARPGPAKPVLASRPATGAAAAARPPSGPKPRIRRPGTGAPTIGEAPPVENTPIDQLPSDPTVRADPPAASPTVETPLVEAPPAPPAPASAAVPPPARTAEVPQPADDAARVRVDIPKRGEGSPGGRGKKLALMGGLVALCVALGGAGAWYAMGSKPPPPAPKPKPPPVSLLAPVAAPSGPTGPSGASGPSGATGKSAEPAPVEAAPVVAADPRARLRVSSSGRPCTIYLDGEASEATPHEIKAKPGKHLVQVVCGEGKPRGGRTVNVKANEVAVLHFNARGDAAGGIASLAVGKLNYDAPACKGAAGCEIRVYREALNLNPVLPEAHRGLGLALYRDGDYEGARFHLENYLLLKRDARDQDVIIAKLADIQRKL